MRLSGEKTEAVTNPLAAILFSDVIPSSLNNVPVSPLIFRKFELLTVLNFREKFPPPSSTFSAETPDIEFTCVTILSIISS